MKYKILRKIYSKLSVLMSDKIFIKIKFRYIFGYNLDLNNPKSFNEKLQWLKLYDRKQNYTKMCDKCEVRNYIKGIIGEEYFVPIIGVYNSFDEIDLEGLPDQFVLKPNHTSGDVYICKSKQDINKLQLKAQVNEWLHRNYYLLHREWQYKNIKRKIICEKYIKDESEAGLKDYKFMCFNGKAKLCYVCFNRFAATGLNVSVYNLDWTHMPYGVLKYDTDAILPKPQNFEKMILLAEKLSKDIPFLRVDFYEAGNQLYFGELTFYPGAGFERFTSESIDYLLGSWINLPEK